MKNNPEAIGRKMTVRTIKRRPIYANYDSGQDLKPFVMTVEQFMELEQYGDLTDQKQTLRNSGDIRAF